MASESSSIASPSRERWQLRDEATSQIRSLILSGRLSTGSYVRLEPIARELGTSVTPIREAMMMLREQGYVELHPNRGFLVRPFSLADLEDLFLVQSLIGSELIGRTAAIIDEETLSDLAEISERLEIFAAARDGGSFELTNDQFHATINQHARAPRLVWLYNGALPLPRYFSTVPGWMQASIVDHGNILTALRERDVEASRTLMAQHVRHAGDLLVRHLRKEGRWPGASS